MTDELSSPSVSWGRRLNPFDHLVGLKGLDLVAGIVALPLTWAAIPVRAAFAAADALRERIWNA